VNLSRLSLLNFEISFFHLGKHVSILHELDMNGSVHGVKYFALLFLIAVKLRNVPQKVVAYKV
jgi:hypothetical protein